VPTAARVLFVQQLRKSLWTFSGKLKGNVCDMTLVGRMGV
jgi:hypothetical protein